MSGQDDAAAERSAHVSRGADGAWGPSLVVERDGAARLRVVVELEAKVARLRDALAQAVAVLEAMHPDAPCDGGDEEYTRRYNMGLAAARSALTKETTDDQGEHHD